MAAGLGDLDRQRLESQGLGSIGPSGGLEVLGKLLSGDRPQVIVLPVDWPTYVGRTPIGELPAILRGLATEFAESPLDGPSELELWLDGVRPGEVRDRLSGHVREAVARVLGLPNSSAIDPDRPVDGTRARLPHGDRTPERPGPVDPQGIARDPAVRFTRPSEPSPGSWPPASPGSGPSLSWSRKLSTMRGRRFWTRSSDSRSRRSRL